MQHAVSVPGTHTLADSGVSRGGSFSERTFASSEVQVDSLCTTEQLNADYVGRGFE
jgi:hypothetical protein